MPTITSCARPAIGRTHPKAPKFGRRADHVEPVEINAGAWYLRALREDELIDDRPALAKLGETDPGYVARRTGQWASDTAYSWAVCDPNTGQLLAEVILDPVKATVHARARPGHKDAAQVAELVVRRFAAATLGLPVHED
jgi:hypothetical protein